MVPVYPDSVGLSGGTEARFQLIIKDSDLYLEEVSNTPFLLIASIFDAPPELSDYNLPSVILKRRVFENSEETSKSLLSFDTPTDLEADDLPSTYDAIAFFAVTTGFSFSTGQAIISSVTYIGSLNL
jgi:hypothetical protein